MKTLMSQLIINITSIHQTNSWYSRPWFQAKPAIVTIAATNMTFQSTADQRASFGFQRPRPRRRGNM